jgi:hypothetical protein
VIDAQYFGWHLLVAKAGSGVNEVQRLVIAGNPTGTLVLSFRDEPAGQIPVGTYPTPSGIEAALEALSTIGAGNVSVAGDGLGRYLVTFQWALGSQDVEELVADTSSVSSGTATVTTVTQGSSAKKKSRKRRPPAPEEGLVRVVRGGAACCRFTSLRLVTGPALSAQRRGREVGCGRPRFSSLGCRRPGPASATRYRVV